MCHTVWIRLYLWFCLCLLSKHCTDCLWLSPASKLMAARSNLSWSLKGARRASVIRSHRLPSRRADLGADCHRVLWTSWWQGPGFLKSSLIVAGSADELLCFLTSIRSDGDRKSVSRRRFSNLGTLLEDIKRSLRDENNSLSDARPHILMCEDVHSCNFLTCARVLHTGMWPWGECQWVS